MPWVLRSSDVDAWAGNAVTISRVVGTVPTRGRGKGKGIAASDTSRCAGSCFSLLEAARYQHLR
jgi:hypothetical protein